MSAPLHPKNTRVPQQAGAATVARTIRPLAAAALAVLALLPAAGPAWALYKVLGPDGKVIGYTDRPPADGKSVTLKSNGATATPEALPYELQQVASRFPVTLYTAKGCGGCDLGRALLSRRGVPFQELTADTERDAAELEKLEGTRAVPVLKIGAQRLSGYNETEWTSYLDTAGYPKASALPSTYRPPAARPLLAPEPAAASAPASAAKPRRGTATPSPAVPASDSSTPPGFRF